MARRSLLRAFTSLSAVAVAGVALAAPASATTLTTGASGYSAGASTGTGALAANLTLSGSLGRLLDYLVAPIVSADLNPLVAALQGTASSVVSTSLGASSPLQAATSPSQSQVTTAPAAFPTDPLPSPCTSGGNQPCYSALSAGVAAAPLASLSLGAVNGYAEQVASTADATNPVFGRATIASTSISVLPGVSGLVNPIVSTGVIASKANCPNDGAAGATKPATAPSANATASGVSVLGGLLSFSTTGGQLSNLVVNGISYPSVLTMPTITVGSVTVSPFGTAVMVSMPLSVAQVLNALGLPASVVSDLNGFLPVSTMTLSIVLGTSTALTNRTAAAYGLVVGADLSGSLSFTLLDLVTATVTVPTGITGGNFGNVLDVRLGSTTCQSGVNGAGGSAARIVPPALV